jgi:plastocyanin
MRALRYLFAVLLLGAAPAGPRAPAQSYYLPDAAASRIVTVVPDGPARAGVTVLTVAVAVKETGPARAVRTFGEVYAFSPAFFAVHIEEPTRVTFWNLQPDDEHDFLLMDPDDNVLMKARLPPLRKTSYVFTFHREGLFRFYCAAHPPEMAGQILILPAGDRSSRLLE